MDAYAHTHPYTGVTSLSRADVKGDIRAVDTMSKTQVRACVCVRVCSD